MKFSIVVLAVLFSASCVLAIESTATNIDDLNEVDVFHGIDDVEEDDNQNLTLNEEDQAWNDMINHDDSFVFLQEAASCSACRHLRRGCSSCRRAVKRIGGCPKSARRGPAVRGRRIKIGQFRIARFGLPKQHLGPPPCTIVGHFRNALSKRFNRNTRRLGKLVRNLMVRTKKLRQVNRTLSAKTVAADMKKMAAGKFRFHNWYKGIRHRIHIKPARR